MKNTNSEHIEWLSERTWEQFREAGLLWWVNRMLHLFGWAIVCEISDNSKDGEQVLRVYPARSRYRGFSEESEDRGFRKLSRYLRDVASQLVEDSELSSGEECRMPVLDGQSELDERSEDKKEPFNCGRAAHEARQNGSWRE